MAWADRLGVLLRWLVIATFAGVSVVAWLPILVLLATVATVAATGCYVDEAASHPCIVAGHDIGDALGAGLLAAFIAGPSLVVGVLTSAVWIVLWRRRKRMAASIAGPPEAHS